MADNKVERQKLQARNKNVKIKNSKIAERTANKNMKQYATRKVNAQNATNARKNPQYEQIIASLNTQSGRKRFYDRLNSLKNDPNAIDPIYRDVMIKEYENIMHDYFNRTYGSRQDNLTAFKGSNVNNIIDYLDNIPGYKTNDYTTMQKLEQDALTSIYHNNNNGLTIDENGEVVPTEQLATDYYAIDGNKDFSPGNRLYALLQNRHGVLTTTPKDTENNFKDDTQSSLINLANANEYTIGNNRFVPSNDSNAKDANNKYISDLASKYADAVLTALKYKGVYDSTMTNFKGMDENKIKQLYPSEAWKINNYNKISAESNRVISVIERELNSLVAAGHKRAYNSFYQQYADILLNSPDIRYLDQNDIDTIAENAKLAKKYNGATDVEVLNQSQKDAENRVSDALNQGVKQ